MRKIKELLSWLFFLHLKSHVKRMKKYAVIVAGGSGQRMGAAVPKQFLELQGKPLLWYTLRCFLSAFDDLQVILVLPSAYREEGSALVNSVEGKDRVEITEGGDTRFQSVRNGLARVVAPSIIFVHDGVRCLVTNELVQRCYQQALEKGSAVPAVAATDSIRIETGNGHVVADRTKIRIIQTPQTFRSDVLLPAFELPYEQSFTDEATVVEANGTPVFLVEGDHQNIKITRPEDLLLAERILASRTHL